MGISVAVMAKEVIEITRAGDPPPSAWEEEIRLLAFKVWQRGCCTEKEADPDCAEVEPWCRASCL